MPSVDKRLMCLLWNGAGEMPTLGWWFEKVTAKVRLLFRNMAFLRLGQGYWPLKNYRWESLAWWLDMANVIHYSRYIIWSRWVHHLMFMHFTFILNLIKWYSWQSISHLHEWRENTREKDTFSCPIICTTKWWEMTK